MPRFVVYACLLFVTAVVAVSPHGGLARRFLFQRRTLRSGAVKAQAQAQARGITVASAHEAEDHASLPPRGNRTLTQGGNWMGADVPRAFVLTMVPTRLSDGEARPAALCDTFVGAFTATTHSDNCLRFDAPSNSCHPACEQ